MSGPVGERNGSYPFLNRFSTGTLRRLLREDFACGEPGTPESDAFITCVAEVVARREAADPGAPQFDVEAGWRDLTRRCPADPETLPSAYDADIARMAAQWAQLQDSGEDGET